MAALACALVVMLVMRKKSNTRRVKARNELKALSFLLGIGVFVGFIAFLIFGGRYSEMLIQHAINTFTGADASANKHIEDITKPIVTILNNPLGLGFGNNGPRALAEFGTANLVESSIYMTIFDMGILLGIFYYVPYAVKLIPQNNSSTLCDIPTLLAIMCLIMYVLLPSIQNYILPFYFYLICGCVDSLRYSQTNALCENSYRGE